MPIPKKLQNHLDKNKIKYEVVEHRMVYTAYDLAQTLKVKLSEIAKTLIVKADKDYALAVLPASCNLDLKKLKKLMGAKKISIAPEGVMKKIFKVKLGAITPFGKLHKVEVYLDKALSRAKSIILGAGSFTESIRMKTKDFIRLEEPKEGNFSQKRK